MAAAAGEAIPTARTLGRSKMVGCCWATKELPSLPVDYLSTAVINYSCLKNSNTVPSLGTRTRNIGELANDKGLYRIAKGGTLKRMPEFSQASTTSCEP
jgi:hypothetical protein